MEQKPSIISSIIESFLKGNLAILLIVISLLAGVVALAITSREEEPQIVVPLADVLISYPGGSAEEVEKLVRQICYRTSDLAYLLKAEGSSLSRYSRHLRREPGVEYYDGYFDEEV